MADVKTRKTILIVDDGFANRALLKKIFSSEYIIETASDGLKALEVMRRISDISAVILDIVIPGLDGYGVLRKMQESKELREIPVIVVTSDEDTATQIKALDYGAMDVITKPYNAQIVKHRVRNIIARKEAEKIEEQNRLYSQQLKLSEVDEKTGIYNKQTFCRVTAEKLRKNTGKKYLIARWDLDRFKVFNDAFGIEEGDRLLKVIGGIYIELSKIEKMLSYGHWYADHFVSCHEAEGFAPEILLSQISGKLSEKFFNNEFVSHFGLYLIDDNSVDVALMCDRALLALRSVKYNYVHHYAYYNEMMRKALVKEQEMVSDINSALSNHEFVVYFQPQYNYASGKMIGAEALVRWDHPTRGIISPGKFIPAFEKNGLISQIDEYIWDKVCCLIRQWMDRGIEVPPISVNVSRCDVYNTHLCDNMLNLIAKYKLSPSMLKLEITESAFVNNQEQLIRVVEQFREKGFEVEMDDFGSGYSSLNALINIPVDVLKLDMGFIKQKRHNPRGGSILSAIIRMAYSIKLPVIAEAVETKQEAEFLKSAGCTLMQGYFFARPMPELNFEKLLANNCALDRMDSSLSEISEGFEVFRDVRAQSSLIFNSFAGGAGILEYTGDNIELVRLNDKFYEVIGASCEEYGDKCFHFMDAFDEENKRKLMEAIEKAINTDEETECDLCAYPLKPGGENIWTRNRFRFLTRNIKSYVIYMAVENISDCMNRLERTMKRLEHLSTAVENVPGGIVNYEIENGKIRILFFSEMAAAMFGYTREEFENNFRDDPTCAVYPDERKEILKKIDQVLESKMPELFLEYRHICKDGSWRWVRLMGNVMHSENGKAIANAIQIDVDRRMRSEQMNVQMTEKLEKQCRSMRTLYNTLPFGILQFVIKDGERKLFSYNNTAWQIMGYRSEGEYVADIKGDAELRRIYSGDIETVKANIQRSLLTGECVKFNHRFACMDGTIRWVSENIQTMISAEKENIIQWVFTGVTAQSQSCLPAMENEYIRGEGSTASRAICAGDRLSTLAGIPEGLTVAIAMWLPGMEETAYSPNFKLFAICGEKTEKIFSQEGSFDFILQDDESVWQSMLAEFKRRGKSEPAALRMKMIDGSFRWIRAEMSNTAGRSSGKSGVLLILSDVDRQIREYNKLEQIAENGAEMIRNSIEGFIICEAGEKLTMVFANERACRMLGFSRDEINLKIANGGQDGPLCKMLKTCLGETGSIKNGDRYEQDQLRFERNDGSVIWLRIICTVSAGQDGKTYIYCTLIDVSESVNIKRLAEEQKRDMDALINAIPSGIMKYSADKKGHIIFVSSNILKMFGYTQEEFKEKFDNRFIQMIYKEDRKHTIEEIGRQLKDGPITCCEYRVETKDGRLLWVYDVGRFVTDENGKKWFYVVLVNNDERKKLEQQLANEKEKLNNIINSIPGGVATYIIKGDKLEMIYCSDNVGAITGRTREEYLEIINNDRDFGIYPADRQVVENAFFEAMNNGKDIDVTYRVLDRNGKLIWLNSRGRQAGKIDGYPVLYMVFLNLSQTTELYQSVLNETDMIIQASDCETRELLFVNEGAVRFSDSTEGDYFGEKCYEYLFGRDKPCEFCKTCAGEHGRTQIQLNGKYYDLHVKCMNWGGRNAYVEYINDVTEQSLMRTRLEEEEERLDEIINNVPAGVGIFEIGTHGIQMIYVSNKVLEMFKICRKDIGYRYNEISEFLDNPQKFYGELYGHLNKLQQCEITKVRAVRTDGSKFWMRIVCGFVAKKDGTARCYATMFDISEFVEKQRRYEWQNERYRLLSESSGAMTFDYSPDDDTMSLTISVSGKGLSEKVFKNYIKTMNLNRHIREESKQSYFDALKKASAKAVQGSIEYQADYIGSGFVWYRASYVSVADETEHVFRVVGRIEDISAVIREKEEIHARAQMDGITGLMNKDSSRIAIEGILQTKPEDRFDAMMFMDIDDFKRINDTLGHLCGDEVLREIGKILKEHFRTDDIVARFGGDEFIAYMRSVNSIVYAREKAADIAHSIEQIALKNVGSIHCSIGIVGVGKDDNNLNELLNRADYALYVSKRNGKNQYTIYDDETMNMNLNGLHN